MPKYYFILDPSCARTELSALLRILDNPSILIRKNILHKYDNVYKYEYEINDLIKDEEINTVYNIISDIAYIPIILTYKMEEFNKDTDILGIKSFIPQIVKSIYGTLPDAINYIERTISAVDDDTNLFREGGNFIEYTCYINNEQLYTSRSNYQYVDLQEYEGYSYIGSDNLIPYIVSQIKENLDVYNINGLYSISNDSYTEWIDYINLSIHKLKSQQLFALYSNNDEEIAAWTELAYFWNGTIRRVDKIVVIQNTISLDVSPESWYISNGKRLIAGEIPRYRIELFTDKLDVDIDIDKYLYKYYSILSYSKLTDKYPELSQYVTEVEVYDDSTVELSFYKYSQVKEFENIFQIISETIVPSRIEVNSVEQGLAIRYSLMKSDQADVPILIKEDDKYYVFSQSDSSNIDPSTALSDFLNAGNPIGLPDNPTELREEFNWNYGYFNTNILRGLKDYPSLNNKVKDVNIYKDEIISKSGRVVSYNASINEEEFLLPNYNAYYLDDKEQYGVFNELMLLDTKDNLLADVEILQPLYEGNPVDDKILKSKWENGEFMNNWSKFVYSSSGLFSRLRLKYI